MDSKQNFINSIYALVLVGLVRWVIPKGVLPPAGDEILTLSLFIFSVVTAIYAIETLVIKLIERPDRNKGE